MFSGKQIAPTPGILHAWYVPEKQMESASQKNQKERYEQIVHAAWQNYYQNTQPEVKAELKRIEQRCQTLTEQLRSGSPASTEQCRQHRDEIIEALIHACTLLAQPARRLGNLTGQTNYFYLWRTLWSEVLEQSEGILSKRMPPYLPMLCGDWHHDSILKRAFTRITKQA